MVELRTTSATGDTDGYWGATTTLTVSPACATAACECVCGGSRLKPPSVAWCGCPSHKPLPPGAAARRTSRCPQAARPSRAQVRSNEDRREPCTLRAVRNH